MRKRTQIKNRIRSELNSDPKKNIYFKKKKINISEKQQFRRSVKWKRFREKVADFYNRQDMLTGKNLLKGFNVHHLKTSDDDYQDISDINNFLPLNNYSHKCVHYLYNYWKDNPEILNNLKNIFEKMKQFENI